MRRATIASAVVLACAMMTAACVKQQVVSHTPVGSAGVGPSLIIEQFLRAVNAKDLMRMGQLFGTQDGPIANRDTREQIEQRMFAIASVLEHQDFEILGEQLVPGRTNEATLLTVKLTINGKTYDVPFTMVRYKNDSWLVEQVGIDAITAPRN